MECLHWKPNSCFYAYSTRRTDLGCLNLDDKGTTFVRNVGNHLPNEIASYPRRLDSSETTLCEVQMTHTEGIAPHVAGTVELSAYLENWMKYLLDVMAPCDSLNAWRFELYSAHARRAVRLFGSNKIYCGIRTSGKKLKCKVIWNT
jgi:hypothetical protein